METIRHSVLLYLPVIGDYFTWHIDLPYRLIAGDYICNETLDNWETNDNDDYVNEMTSIAYPANYFIVKNILIRKDEIEALVEPVKDVR